MGYWITDKGGIIQDDFNNKIITESNQLFNDDGVIYLVPRNTVSDNYTIPFGFNKTKYDVRPSHLHDIPCKYHQAIVVDIPLDIIYRDYIYLINDRVVCRDIPKENLKLVDISFNQANDLLYKSMNSICNIPKSICKLYRACVNLNLFWILEGRSKINLNNIYKYKLYTCKCI